MPGTRSLWQRSTRARSPFRAAALVLALLALLTGVTIALWRGGRGTSAQTSTQYVKLWPAFSMTYSVYQADVGSGQVGGDQTDQLEVLDERNWHEVVIRDAVNPKAVGSTVSLKGGVLTVFRADLNHTESGHLSSADAVTSITPELSPLRYISIRDGKDRGWIASVPAHASATLAPSRIAKTRSSTTDCLQPDQATSPYALICPPGKTSVPVEERIEYDAASLDTSLTAGKLTPVGGIPVYYERSVNGVLVYRFEAESFQVH